MAETTRHTNVPEILRPEGIVHSQNDCPYASRTEIAWLINRLTGRKPSTVEPTNFLWRKSKQTQCVTYVPTSLKTWMQLRKCLEMTFNSLILLKAQWEKHNEISLPVNDAALKMPNNRAKALKRMSYLKKKLKKNPKFHRDCNKFVTNIFEKGYAKKILVEKLCCGDGRVWYLPHYGVCYPKKPEKICVVFDCSAEYHGTSLNKELHQGSKQTNMLLGVILQFWEK